MGGLPQTLSHEFGQLPTPELSSITLGWYVLKAGWGRLASGGLPPVCHLHDIFCVPFAWDQTGDFNCADCFENYSWVCVCVCLCVWLCFVSVCVCVGFLLVRACVSFCVCVVVCVVVSILRHAQLWLLH